MTTNWAAGRYEAVGERIAPIADEVLDAAARRTPLRGATLVDLACGTGSAALSATARGAAVTGVDITSELIALAAGKPGGSTVTWVTADAADTGLKTASFDVAVSNMGIIFVPPDRQVAELARLLKPGGVLSFSAWIRTDENPFSDPVAEVLGPPPAAFSPDQWGDAETLTERLTPHFDAIDLIRGLHPWEFDSPATALHFLRTESPVHVEIFRRAGPARRERLAAAFRSALRPHAGPAGTVGFTAPYVIVTARRRG